MNSIFGTEGVIYEENGVKISSFPAIHILDGSVSFRLDWNGRSFVFGGDSTPNKWFIKYAKGAELVVHECFMTPEQTSKFLGAPLVQGIYISAYITHRRMLSARSCRRLNPAMPSDTISGPGTTCMTRPTRKPFASTYDGPLTLADGI